MTVLVIGAGFAGMAAAWWLERRGQDVRILWEGPGASALYSGALDRNEWPGPPDPRPLSRDAEAFLAELGAWEPASGSGARLATASGLLRPARCHDRALLDLEPLRGRRIDVVDFGRPGWDAELLASAWNASGWARLSRTEFRAVRVEPPSDDLRWLGPIDLAERVDDPMFAARLGEALHGASDGEAPLLLGPWLGTRPESVLRLRQIARRPLGETLSEPGEAAGLRFEAVRDSWFERSRARSEQGIVTTLARGADGYDVVARLLGENGERRLDGRFGAVILAIGGLVGGGVRFLAGPGPSGRSFSLSLSAPVGLRLGGREVALGSGALGADLQMLGMSALETVGLAVDERQLAHAPDLFAAGDVVADRPRTALEAIYAGMAAARAVCRVRASDSP